MCRAHWRLCLRPVDEATNKFDLNDRQNILCRFLLNDHISHISCIHILSDKNGA